jgi:hypothetical protein
MKYARVRATVVYVLAAGSAPAWGVVWDGNGSPEVLEPGNNVYFRTGDAPSGYFGPEAEHDSYISTYWAFNQLHTGVPAPGVAFQKPTIGFGRFNIDDPTLDYAAGWTVGARMFLPVPDQADPNSHAAVFEVNDGTRRVWVYLSDGQVGVGDAGVPLQSLPASQKISVDMNAGYHSLVLSKQPGISTVSLSVDGGGPVTAPISTDAGTSGVSGPNEFRNFRFADNTDQYGRSVLWDSIAINEALPTPAAALISLNSPTDATVIRGGTSLNMTFRVRNLGEAGGVNLATTSITPKALAGTSYSAIANVSGLIPQGSSSDPVSGFSATTTSTTPIGTHILNIDIDGNASNSIFTSPDELSPKLTVLDHSNGSFAPDADDDAHTVNIGNVALGLGAQSGFDVVPFEVFNFETFAGFTARMNLEAANVMGTGDTAVVLPVDDIDPPFPPEFFGVLGSDSAVLFAAIDTNVAPGTYTSNWSLDTTDHGQFEGAANADAALSLTITGTVVGFTNWDEDNDGNWTNNLNWENNAAPNGVGAGAKFGQIITQPRTVTLDVARTMTLLVFDNFNSYTLTGSGLTMDGGTGGALMYAISGGHTIAAPVQLNDNLSVSVAGGATLTISSQVAAGAGLSLNKNGDGTLEMKNVRVANLNLNAGNVRVLASGGNDSVSRVQTLAIDAQAALDLTDNDLVVDYDGASPLATITQYLQAGYNAGAWDGNGIRTSQGNATTHTLGVGEASVLGVGDFSGQPVDTTSVLVKFTYYGDADLDGDVDVGDLGRLATAWQTADVWTGGDFDLNGSVDVNDLGLLATNWQAGVGNPLAPDGPPWAFAEAAAALGLPTVAVPEPGCLALFGAVGVLSTRRRRRI